MDVTQREESIASAPSAEWEAKLWRPFAPTHDLVPLDEEDRDTSPDRESHGAPRPRVGMAGLGAIS